MSGACDPGHTNGPVDRSGRARQATQPAPGHDGPMPDEPAVLLALAAGGDRLRVAARPRTPAGQDEAWFEVTCDAVGEPFRGKVHATLTAEDLAAFRDGLAALVPPGEVALGGDRAAELRLVVEPQTGGAPGAWAVEASLTPSGDDPYPTLRWLIFDQAPFTAAAVAAIDALLGRVPDGPP